VSGRHDLFPVAPSGDVLVSRTEVPEGTLIEVMCTDVQGLVDGARHAGLDAVAQLVAPPRLALAFSGVDRVPLLGGVGDEQTAGLLEGLDGAPLAGFHAYGEFARRVGPGGFHMTSVSVLAL
jgi:small ligand-binding sensory domain FIST